jgi:single-strand DNA-binding protein
VAVNESTFSVTGYVASEPHRALTPTGVPTMTMRLAWTPRKYNSASGGWSDEPSCFVTVKCWRSLAENAYLSLRKGMPVLVSGTLRIREYEGKDGNRRTAVDIHANAIGHDLSRGIATFEKLHRTQGQQAGSQPAEDESVEPAAGSGDDPATVADHPLVSGAEDDFGRDESETSEEMPDEAPEIAEEPVGASL